MLSDIDSLTVDIPLSICRISLLKLSLHIKILSTFSYHYCILLPRPIHSYFLVNFFGECVTGIFSQFTIRDSICNSIILDKKALNRHLGTLAETHKARLYNYTNTVEMRAKNLKRYACKNPR